MRMKKKSHKPVLVREVVESFKGVGCRVFLDGTLGLGGHAKAILKAHGEIERYIGIDRDLEALEIAKENLSSWDKVEFFHGNFLEFDRFLKGDLVDGFFLDVGVSSMQLEDSERGFSFMTDGPLDMRMDRSLKLTAEDVVNEFPERKLGEIFREYGEEMRWKKIARAIVNERGKRRIRTTFDLKNILSKVCGRRRSLNPATLVFQALRIFVNDELALLKKTLFKAFENLSLGGRIAVISFHSLEDRIVKWAFRESPILKVVTKKPVVASLEEVRKNKRARSAKLRVAERL